MVVLDLNFIIKELNDFCKVHGSFDHDVTLIYPYSFSNPNVGD